MSVGKREGENFGLGAPADEDGTVLVKLRHSHDPLPIISSYCRHPACDRSIGEAATVTGLRTRALRAVPSPLEIESTSQLIAFTRIPLQTQSPLHRTKALAARVRSRSLSHCIGLSHARIRAFA